MARNNGSQNQTARAGQASAQDEETKIERLLEDAADFYHRQLLTAKDGNLGDKYLLSKRFARRLVKERRIGWAATGGLKEYLRSKGHADEDGLKYGLLKKHCGEIVDVFHEALIFPVVAQKKVVYLVARQLAPGAKPKYLNIKRAIQWLYNEEILATIQRVIIDEGIPDTLTLIQHDYPAVGTLGAGLFKEEFLPKFATVPERYVCFDTDFAGVRGMGKVAALFNGFVKIIALPDAIKDVSDFFQQHTAQAFDALLKQAKWWVNYALDRAPATEIHLTDIEASKYINQRVQIPLRAAGIGTVCFVPTRFRAHYTGADKVARTQEFIVPQNDILLIQMCRESQDDQLQDLRKFARAHLDAGAKIQHIEKLEHLSMTQILALPRIKELKKGASGAIITETGKEYRQKIAYFQGETTTSSTLYDTIGYVVADPRTSEARLLVSDFKEIRENFDDFQLTPEVLTQLASLRRQESDSIEDHLDKLADSVAYHITRIYGATRQDATIANLLCYHAPLYFYYDGEPIPGWPQIASIGDTTTGKTQIPKRIRNYVDVGVYVTGETCSRTGFLYAIDTKTLSSPILAWGLLPLQDRSLLIIDGANYISAEDWGTAREARRSGKLIVERIVKGEHPCRTRLILAANTPKPLHQYLYPIEALRDVFQEPDIARLDLCLCFSGADVPREEINLSQEERTRPSMAIEQAALRNSVFWSWSRRPEDILISEDVVLAVNDAANALLEQFGSATEIPLISNDVKYKVIRLAVALACLLHSANETYEQVIVTPEIVSAVQRLIERVYSAANCRLDRYASDRRAITEITPEELTGIQQALQEEGKKDRSNILTELIRLFRTNNLIRRSELSAQLDRSDSTIKAKLVFFKRFGLIRSGKSGYAKTEKFIQLLNKLEQEKASMSTPAASASTPPSIVPTTSDPAGHESVQPGNGEDSVQTTGQPPSPEQILKNIQRREQQRKEGHGTSEAERQD